MMTWPNAWHVTNTQLLMITVAAIIPLPPPLQSPKKRLRHGSQATINRKNKKPFIVFGALLTYCREKKACNISNYSLCIEHGLHQ